MKNSVIILCFFLALISCNQVVDKHQFLKTDSKFKDFSKLWKADSLGLMDLEQNNTLLIKIQKFGK